MTLEQKLPHAPNFEKFLMGIGNLEVEMQRVFSPYMTPLMADARKEGLFRGNSKMEEIIDQHKNMLQENYSIIINGKEIGLYRVFFNNLFASYGSNRIVGQVYEGRIPGYQNSAGGDEFMLKVEMEFRFDGWYAEYPRYVLTKKDNEQLPFP